MTDARVNKQPPTAWGPNNRFNRQRFRPAVEPYR